MRGVSRRPDRVEVSLGDFACDAATLATLRHPTFPWFDACSPKVTFSLSPIESVQGARDRLSLIGQYAAHQAFLQIAGVGDGVFDPAEWRVVRKRGCDCRLLRVRMRASSPGETTEPLTLVQEFGASVRVDDLAALQQAWARPDVIYAEILSRLQKDAAADLRWLTQCAHGEVLSPGPDVLHALWGGEPLQLADPRGECARTVRALSSLDPSVVMVEVGSAFPIHRYAALSGFGGIDPSQTEGVLAERLAERLARHRHVVILSGSMDEPSRRVVAILRSMGSAAWIDRESGEQVPETRHFVCSTRLSARRELDARLSGLPNVRDWFERFTSSAEYRAYLDAGEVPVIDDAFALTPEPNRSYVAALALLGCRIPRAVAEKFLQLFLFNQPLEELAIDHVAAVEDGFFVFAGEAMRRHCSAHLPPASRPALCRAAAAVAERERAGLLLFEAGDRADAFAVLESIEWHSPDETVATLLRVPLASLSAALARSLAHALVDCGRYRDARNVAAALPDEQRDFVLARCERRGGDYATALRRLARLPEGEIKIELLRVALLRLSGALDQALRLLSSLVPATEEERMEVAYERAVLAIDLEEPPSPVPDAEHYLVSRCRTYEALAAGALNDAERHARAAIRQARTASERIDAWLDLVYASFSSGRWSETRALAMEALAVVDEAQGDRAAAGILYTLAYLAADEGRWWTAEQYIARLRAYYSGMSDANRLFEIKLLDAHLAFARADLETAARLAREVLSRHVLLTQIREAAALVADEIDWMENQSTPLRSSGRSGNRELDERHRLLRRRRGDCNIHLESSFEAELLSWEQEGGEPPVTCSRSEGLKLLRSAIAMRRTPVAEELAANLGVSLISRERAAGRDVQVLKMAAVAEFPFGDDVFDGVAWCHAARNRLGQWSTAGTFVPPPAELDRLSSAPAGDWMACSDRELLCVAGSESWPESSRRALASLFRLRFENVRLRRVVEQEADSARIVAVRAEGIVGESPAIRAVFDLIERVGARDVPVCLLGESGTGKELAGRALHRASARRHKAFMAINCAALPEQLIESELFGHVRGAFTGADRDRTGVIEAADGGTLFLDEIGEMPLSAQAKLLRFLQDGELRRVGDSVNRHADVRVVSATNRKLESAVDEGRFREDLYYRIRGVEIVLPPLRDRGSDVMLLARHFLEQERGLHRQGPQSFTDEAEMLLRSYGWPGNVRELQNTVRAAHAMAGDRRLIDVEHLPERLRQVRPLRPAAGSYQDAVARFRRDLIEKSLAAAAGNQNRAAAMLNISRQALAYQIRELGILVRKEGGQRAGV